MRLIIKQRMRDKYTGEIYEAGAEIEFDTDRAKELLADPRGLAEKVPTKKSASATKKRRGDSK